MKMLKYLISSKTLKTCHIAKIYLIFPGKQEDIQGLLLCIERKESKVQLKFEGFLFSLAYSSYRYTFIFSKCLVRLYILCISC